MMQVKRVTPGGTQYLVWNMDTKTSGTLNHACHVVLFGKILGTVT